MATTNKGAKPVGEPDKGMPRDTPEQPVVDGGQKGAKPVGEPDKNAGQRTGPELPVVEPIDGMTDDERQAAHERGVAHDNTQAKKARKRGPGQVTYRFADGSTVTNDVDDVANPPAVTHDTHGAGEIVEA